MTPQERLLADNKISLAVSDLTGRIYLDDDLACHVYIQRDGRTMASDIAQTHLSDPKKYYLDGLKSNCYRSGALQINIHTESHTIETHPLSEMYLPIGYYNQPLTAVVTRFRQTKDMNCLSGLPKCKYLIPTRITNRTHISYPVAHMPENDAGYYVVHTDYSAFKKWLPEGKEWYPLEIDYITLRQIIRRDGIVINPAIDRIVLDNSVLPKAEGGQS